MRIIHIMANGTILDKIDGHVVKPEDNPEVYKILDKLNNKEEANNVRD